MLKRGWMNRYLPERAAPVADVATAFGYAWAGLMFGSAALNIALALSLDAKTWAAVMSAWGIAQQDRPVPDPVRRDDRRRHAGAARDAHGAPCTPRACAAMLLELDADDFVGACAARGLDLDGVADGLADQRAAERRGDRDAPLGDVGLVVADDLVVHLLVGVLVGQLTVAPNFTILPDSLETSITSAREMMSSSSTMRPSMKPCVLARGGVFGVLREIAVLARLGDRPDDRRALHALQMLQLVLEALEPSAVIGTFSMAAIVPNQSSGVNAQRTQRGCRAPLIFREGDEARTCS